MDGEQEQKRFYCDVCKKEYPNEQSYKMHFVSAKIHHKQPEQQATENKTEQAIEQPKEQPKEEPKEQKKRGRKPNIKKEIKQDTNIGLREQWIYWAIAIISAIGLGGLILWILKRKRKDKGDNKNGNSN